MKYVLGIDLGTSGTKTVLFDQAAYAVASKLFPDIAAYVDDRYVSAHSDGQL